MIGIIKIDMVKAKEIAHNIRRRDRDEKMRLLDIDATIPSKAEEAEAKRQEIREFNDLIQQEIDEAETPEDLKVALDKL